MNNKKIVKICSALVGLLLIFSAIPTSAIQSASASRDIVKQTLAPGQSTDITVTIRSNITQSLALDEDVPVGWVLTRVDDDADDFKSSTNEWVWFSFDEGTTETVTYRLTVPADATAGAYPITGTIMNASDVIDVTGEDTITVTSGPAIEFVPPTPENNSITTDDVTINVTVTDPDLVSTVILNWNGANETMSMIGDGTWSTTKTDLSPGTYTYKVYANDTYDNWGESETRVVTTGKSILDYYRSWLSGGDPTVVETQELLKAADDWSNDVVPPGFTDPILTQELLQFADEWSAT